MVRGFIVLSDDTFMQVLTSLRTQLEDPLVIGVETASKLNSLSPVSLYPLRLLSTTQKPLNVPDTELIIVSDIVLDGAWDYCGALITSPEQTIIDLIRFDRDPQTITESLCEYYYSSKHCPQDTWGNLPSLMERWGLLSDFESYIEDALDHAKH